MKPVMNNPYRSEKGMTTIMMAVLLPIIIGFLGLAVDAGSVFMTKHRLQNTADAAALSAISELENSSTVVDEVITESGLDPVKLSEITVERGEWDDEGKTFTPSAEGEALRVRLAQDVPIYFLRVLGVDPQQNVSAEATANLRKVGAVVGLGATAISNNPDAGVLNALLEDLLGTSISLSAVGWQGVADAHLDLVRFLNLAKADLNVADIDDVLDAEVTVAKMVELMIGVLETDSDNAAVVANLNTLKGQIGIGNVIRIGDMLQLGSGTEALARADVNLLSMIMATAQLANFTSGVTVMADVPLGVLSDLDVKVKIAEPPVIKIMKEGDTIHSAGARIYLHAQALSLLGGSPLIDLPLYLELGSGDGMLVGISEGGVDMQISSSLSKLFIGSITENAFFTDSTVTQGDFGQTTIINVPLLYSVRAQGYADAQGAEQSHTFTSSLFPESVSVYGDAGSAVGNLLGSLDLDLHPTLLGILPLPAGFITTVTEDILGIISPLLEALLNPVSGLTGVHLGRTDVTVYDYAYEAVLVN